MAARWLRADRRYVLKLVRASASATRSGEYDLAARGYYRAFGLSGSTALLLSLANMFQKVCSWLYTVLERIARSARCA